MDMAHMPGHSHLHQPVHAGGSAHWAAVALLLAAVGLVDRAAGYDLSVLVLYLLPLGYATSRLGYRSGLVTIVPATLVWCLADLGHPYEYEWVLYLNGLSRAVFFACGVIAVHHLGLGPAPHEGTGRAVRSRSVGLCGCCGRIRDEERGAMWYSVREFLQEGAGFRVLPRVCHDCARRDFSQPPAVRSAPEATVTPRTPGISPDP